MRRRLSSRRRTTSTTGGGSEPRWKGDGRELFYLASDGNVMAVAVNTDQRFRAAAPRPLFRTEALPSLNPYHMVMDVTPDGQRFLLKLRARQPDRRGAGNPIANHRPRT